MAELTDYQISQINRSIQNIRTKYNDIVKILNRDRFSSDYKKAESALSSYAREESNALKEAEKAIKKAMNGSGFFSSGGLNKVLENKINDSCKQIDNIIIDYHEEINTIIASLPKIGVKGKSTYSFDETEYTGDKDYSEARFDYSDNNSDNTLIFAGKNASGDSEMVNGPDMPSHSQKDTEFKHSDSSSSTELTVNSKVDIIQIGEISNPSLKRIKLTNVSEIQANAFNGCNNLELLVINRGIGKISNNAFRGIGDTCILAFEDDQTTALSRINDTCLDGRRVIFDYSSGDELFDKAAIYHKPEAKPVKRAIIKKDTPLDNNDIKSLFLERNAKYALNVDELNKGIECAGTNVDKDAILFYALLARRERALNDGSFWDYASALNYAIKLGKTTVNKDEILSIIYGLLFLNSSGYRMVNGKYNPYKDNPDRLCYDPRIELGVLFEIITAHNISNEELVEGYKQSKYVNELNKHMQEPYYTIDDSIKLMLMALKTPDYPFYPAKSGIIRIH